jgi:23S rRNA (adenine2503-C2)-methyltransferase
VAFAGMDHPKQNLIGLALDDLTSFVEQLGERPYRGSQLFRWLYKRRSTSFHEMTDVAQSFRERLAESADLRLPRLVARDHSSADGTTKFLFALDDDRRIETVYIPRDTGPDGDADGRRTLCVSTQVGCPLDCAFCATGTMGFARNLTTGEIVGQVLSSQTHVRGSITNVVFMGMGEPMLNYDPMIRSADILTAGLGIAARRITISTAGWVDGIRRMADERRRNKLAVSLHSVRDDVRTRLMPVNKRHPLKALREALAYYYSRTRLRVTYEYIFFEGVNDGDDDVRRLIKFARAIPCKINVIPYHSIVFTHPVGAGSALRPSPRMEDLVRQLRDANLTVMVRSSAGEDIRAACGQLAVGNNHRSSRRMTRDDTVSHHQTEHGVVNYETSPFRPSRSGKRDTGKAAF